MLVFGTSPLLEPESLTNAAQGLKISDRRLFFLPTALYNNQIQIFITEA